MTEPHLGTSEMGGREEGEEEVFLTIHSLFLFNFYIALH
jgi:hypothetical protein